jgi:hypothetical protein
VLLVAEQRSQHTRVEKTCKLNELVQPQPDGQRWAIAVLTTVESEMVADQVISALTAEPKSRGTSSRSVLFEQTIRRLDLPVYSDLRQIFKHPDAERLLVRCPTNTMPRSRVRRTKK